MSKNSISRRGFVLKSAAGIGGLAVAQFATSAAVVENKLKKEQTKEDILKQKKVVIEENDVVIENDSFSLRDYKCQT